MSEEPNASPASDGTMADANPSPDAQGTEGAQPGTQDRAEPGESSEPPEASEALPAAGRSEAFRLRPEPPQVMRLSRKAMAIIGAVAGIGIGGSLIYALSTPGHDTAPELYDTDSRNRADVVTGGPADYAKVPQLGPPLPGDLGRPILSAQSRQAAIPSSGSGAPGTRTAAQQARQRVAEERETARTSKLFASARRGGASAGTDLPALPAALLSGADERPSAASEAPASGQDGKRAFLAARGDRAVTGAARLDAPASPWILQAGSIIPAALISGIHSDLPGQITAQVTRNVYDSPTGRVLLIPQGSRLIGEYDSAVSAGQNRLLLVWDRLILPGGRSIQLDRMPGADQAGNAGLQDRTNFHWTGMLGAALVSTLLGAGSEFAASGDDALTRALRNGTQDTVNQTGQQVVRRQLGRAPTLTIRPGFRFAVMVTHDLVLEPVSEGDGR